MTTQDTETAASAPDDTTVRNVIEAALLAAGGPLTLDKLGEIFGSRGTDPGKPALKAALTALSEEYSTRGIEIREVASGYRIQVRSSVRDWLQPLFEERAPRYTRALLETLALIAYRQPITRAEIEEVRGVAVSSNIVRTLMERGWIRVVGYRDVPGKPSMLGTTREFLDYFGLRRLDDLPPLAEIDETLGTFSPQEDFLEALEAAEREQARSANEAVLDNGDDDAAGLHVIARSGSVADDSSEVEIVGADLRKVDRAAFDETDADASAVPADAATDDAADASSDGPAAADSEDDVSAEVDAAAQSEATADEADAVESEVEAAELDAGAEGDATTVEAETDAAREPDLPAEATADDDGNDRSAAERDDDAVEPPASNVVRLSRSDTHGSA